MADSMKTGPTHGDIARLDAKLDLLPPEHKIEISQMETDLREQERAIDLELLALPEHYLAPLLEVINAINHGNKIDIQYEKLQYESLHAQLVLTRQDHTLPPLCRMLLHVSLSVLYATYPSTPRTPLPWLPHLKQAVRAWLDCDSSDEVKPSRTGRLWFMLSKMLRRLREEIKDGEFQVEKKAKVLDREVGWRARQIEDVLCRIYGVYVKGCMPRIWAVPGVQVPKKDEVTDESEDEGAVCDEVAVSDSEVTVSDSEVESPYSELTMGNSEGSGTVVPDVAQQLEGRRGSLLSIDSMVALTSSNHVLDTPAEEHVTGYTSVFEEEEALRKKRILSLEDQYHLETLDMVFAMLKIDIAGPVYEYGDLI